MKISHSKKLATEFYGTSFETCLSLQKEEGSFPFPPIPLICEILRRAKREPGGGNYWSPRRLKVTAIHQDSQCKYISHSFVRYLKVMLCKKKRIKDQTKYAPPFQDNFSQYIGFYSIWLFKVNLGCGMQLIDEHPLKDL